MMHTLNFEKCWVRHMQPCVDTCPLYSSMKSACYGLMKIELTYYDDSLTLIVFDNPILDAINPDIVRDEFNKGFSPMQERGLVGKVSVFGVNGHAE